MEVLPTKLAGVMIIEPKVFQDPRGFFMEVWQREKFRAKGIDVGFVQENHSRSRRGAVRGLHYQVERPQGKLVRVVQGSVLDVAVDLRRSSATFGQWVGVELTEENRRLLWIPPGFAHGFAALSDSADMVYLCTETYAPELERTVQWNDPRLAIEWRLDGMTPSLSDRDANHGIPFDRAPHFP